MWWFTSYDGRRCYNCLFFKSKSPHKFELFFIPPTSIIPIIISKDQPRPFFKAWRSIMVLVILLVTVTMILFRSVLKLKTIRQIMCLILSFLQIWILTECNARENQYYQKGIDGCANPQWQQRRWKWKCEFTEDICCVWWLCKTKVVAVKPKWQWSPGEKQPKQHLSIIHHLCPKFLY